MQMKVMVVGGGAREHTIVWALRQDNRVREIYVVPGNAGTAMIAKNLPISAENVPAIVAAAKENKVDSVVIGPEKPLDLGLVDALDIAGIPAFGPNKAAARIESSKVFSRRLMLKYGILCSPGAIFSDYEHLKAQRYILKRSLPIVIKADGLFAGKGVVIAKTYDEALQTLHKFMIERAVDESGRVIIDDYLQGREASLIVVTDGKTVVPLVTACDYKKAYNNDEGPNTGGMGGYSPSEFLDKELITKIIATVFVPMLRGMAKEGRPYKGVLYAGLMVMPNGEIYVLEFNARFGDPETQVQLPLLKTPLLDIISATIEGRLDKLNIEWSDQSCVGVVIASEGYPDNPQKVATIRGLSLVSDDVMIFHAGTKGRILTVVAIGKDYAEAREKVYRNLPLIKIGASFYRNDIAARIPNQ